MPYADLKRRREYDREKARRRYADPAKRAAMLELKRVRYIEVKAFLDAKKSRPCADCGGMFPPYAMDFHHTNPDTKIFSLGDSCVSRSLRATAAEILKCVVLCSNCHRIREHADSRVAERWGKDTSVFSSPER